MRHLPALLLASALFCLACGPAEAPETAPDAAAGTIRIATWNVENWRDHFDAWRRRRQRARDEAEARQKQIEAFQNDEDNWEIAQVLLDPEFAPDIVVVQEGCAQEELEQFNREWLGGAFATLRVLPSNDERGQTLAILLREGFEIVEIDADHHRLPDPDDLNPRSDRLFARGPAFVLVQTPSGNRLWVGTNHQKSKAGEDGLADTRWRNAEALATRRIIQDLAARSDGAAGVVFLGDLNDQLGIQAWELEGGGDTVANLVGPPEAGLELATRKLAEEGVASYMGYWRPTYRGLIDHIVITQDLAPSVGQVAVFDSAWARVASDHLPVYIDLRLDGD